MTTIPPAPPPPDEDRRAFRRALIDGSSVPFGMKPELAWMAGHLPAVAAIAKTYPDVYRRLRGAWSPRQCPPEVHAEALALAADIATVMQSLREREDILEGLHQVDGLEPAPTYELDQLFSALVLMAGDAGMATPEEF